MNDTATTGIYTYLQTLSLHDALPFSVVQLGGLVHGSGWIDDGCERSSAEARLRAGLERHWSPHRGVYPAIRDIPANAADDLLDAAQLLAVPAHDPPSSSHHAEDSQLPATHAAIAAPCQLPVPLNSSPPPSQLTAPTTSRPNISLDL